MWYVRTYREDPRATVRTHSSAFQSLLVCVFFFFVFLSLIKTPQMNDDIIRAGSSQSGGQTPREVPGVRQNLLYSRFHMVAMNKHAFLAGVVILEVYSADADAGFIHCWSLLSIWTPSLIWRCHFVWSESLMCSTMTLFHLRACRCSTCALHYHYLGSLI